MTFVPIPAHIRDLSIRDFFFRAMYHAYTLFLFTRTDIITTVVPVTSLSLASGPVCIAGTCLAFRHTLQAIVWTFLHLLQFNIFNQSDDPVEDVRNKPWRPIPSGRISLHNARKLRVISIVFCWAVSSLFGTEVFKASLAFTAFVISYHFQQFATAGWMTTPLHGHWAMKSVVISVGYVILGWGSTLLAGCNRNSLDAVSRVALLVTFFIFVTSTHAQDFRDVEGDRLIGRKTIPILLPELARYTPMIVLGYWSYFLTKLWALPHEMSFAVFILAALVGLRYILWRGKKSDRTSYTVYNIWLTVALALPGVYRYHHGIASAIA